MLEKKRPTIAIMAGNSESEYISRLIAGFRNCAKEEDVNLIFLMGPHIPRYCKDILAGSFAWDYDFQFHKEYAKLFNAESRQPFYVELSVGVYEFICDEDTDLTQVFKESDAVLYEQKKNRRKSIKKE